MAGIQYDMVQENDPYYELVRGDFFSNFDTFKEFKYQIDKFFPSLWNLEEISRRENGSRAESLIKCTFNIPNSSHHPFFIYLCQFEGGGRKNRPYEQRIQFREHTKWVPDLNTLNIANKFHDAVNADCTECYLIGIYKRSENDHDVIFTGIHPNWMYDKRIESESTSPTSFQVKIYPFQEAYKFGQAIFTKEDGQRAICFKPNKILWYMENRDRLHLEDINKVKKMMIKKPSPIDGPRQVIYYGAPGTGKSHIIKEETKGEEVIRTTFHPDTDYSTFVGAYKPTTDMLPICNELGEPMKIGGTSLHKEQIVYKFVAQAFLQAYIQAWKMWKDGTPQYLVIEEINRGNCAQIFGDLFQLLDRNDAGYSDYPITADKDMRKQLRIAFNDLTLSSEKIDEINSMYNGKPIAENLLEGELLVLPNNLYIWATMNTSDQSLFPIDSAFKRRWDWTYMPISDAGKNWVIKANGNYYDWWDFVTKINTEIATTTNSEDKKLGYFFCKANNDKVITAERFVGKVLFYLWNDVFKDYEFNNDIFNDEKDSEGQERKLIFDKFYKSDGHESKVAEEKVELFLKNLDIRIVREINNDGENTDPDINEVDDKGNTDTSRYSINGIGSFGKCRAPFEAIKMFCSANPSLSNSDVVSKWLSLGVKIPNLIETETQYKERTTDSKDQKLADKSKTHTLSDGTTIYVSNQFNPERIQDFVNKVNESDLGIHIEKIRE